MVLGLCANAMADPLAGEQLKFFQSPLSAAGAPNLGIYPVGASYNPATDFASRFPGQDILSTASYSTTNGNAGYVGTMAADDFSDTNPMPIGHIMWWGSYINNPNINTFGSSNGDIAPSGVQQFQISIYTNNSPPTGGPSTPATLVATETVTAGALSPSSGTFTETPVSADTGSPDGPLFQYNAELAIPLPDAVYPNVEWLSIVALTPFGSSLQWGWHDRNNGIFDPYAAPAGADGTLPPGYHFLDDAVQGGYIGGPQFTASYNSLTYSTDFDGVGSSMDLAFALYTPVPEPTSLAMLGLGAIGILLRRNKKR